MKLRIRGNSIRLRLSQGDLATLLDDGAVEERVAFPAGPALSYRLEAGTGPEAEAEYRDGRIVVRFPRIEIIGLGRPDAITLRAELPLPGDELTLLVEKDFQCLNPRADEDDADLFPNPDA